MKNVETLLEYASRERQGDPWWEPVYQILVANEQQRLATPAVRLAPAAPAPAVALAVDAPEPAKTSRYSLEHKQARMRRSEGRMARRGRKPAEPAEVVLSTV